jgi:hypothetical protein
VVALDAGEWQPVTDAGPGSTTRTTTSIIHLTHHQTNMAFDSRFCSPDCAVAYLEDGLVEDT